MTFKRNIVSDCLGAVAIIAAFSVNAYSAGTKSDETSEMDAIIEQANKIGNGETNDCEFDLQITSNPLRLSISIQIPIATDNPEGTIKARNALYAMAAGECALITRHIPGHCEITNFKIQQKTNNRRNASNQDHKQILGANINFEILPRASKSECKK